MRVRDVSLRIGFALTARIFIKLIFAVLCVLIVALTAVDYLASQVARETYIRTLTKELGDKANLLAHIEPDGLHHIQPKAWVTLSAAAGGRLTLVANDGRVLGDSEADPGTMENHAHRPEIAAALRGERGYSLRQSATIKIPYHYVAVPVPEGALRLAVPVTEVDEQVAMIRRRLLTGVALSFLPAILVAGFFARYVSSKLAGIIEYAGELSEGNFEARLDTSSNDELGILSRELNETGEKLQIMFEELQRERSELEKLERVRKDFVINVSHELRTPLASIQGYTETLLDGAVHDPAHNIKFLSIIRQNAERLGRLTADLLTLSRVELKTQKFQFASYYINGILQHCMESLQPLADKKRIAMHLRPAPDGTEVFCDSEAVHQILVNLMENALKYTPEGGEVTIVATPDHELVEIGVRDTGPGIPEEDLPRLFERFYRVDKARSRELGGTGLGLSIVKHLVKAQGGQVRVESVLHQGSLFAFTLPVQDLGLHEEGEVQPQLTAL